MFEYRSPPLSLVKMTQCVFGGTSRRADDPADPGVKDLHHFPVYPRAAALHDFRAINFALARRRLDRGG